MNYIDLIFFVFNTFISNLCIYIYLFFKKIIKNTKMRKNANFIIFAFSRDLNNFFIIIFFKKKKKKKDIVY